MSGIPEMFEKMPSKESSYTVDGWFIVTVFAIVAIVIFLIIKYVYGPKTNFEDDAALTQKHLIELKKYYESIGFNDKQSDAMIHLWLRMDNLEK